MDNTTRVSARTPALDVKAKYETSYCIPIWLRDEQIKLASARKNVGRIQGHEDTVRQEPIAIACYGPSLQDTWEQLKSFQYIISCSGAHKFLLERGVIPTWHVEVDPRAHKVELLGTPHPDVTYLPASTCHPAYFDHLEKAGVNVQLWHVFANEEDAIRTLPQEEWALTGGPDVGLRSMLIARFFGFRQLHVFGMDGCSREKQGHAAAHPNAVKNTIPCEYNGVQYQTTPALLECAKAVAHELDMMKDVTATFYGDGLVQAMMKDYKPNHPAKAFIGLVKPALISTTYRELNSQLHRENLAYGVGGGKHADTVMKLADSIKSRSILDYGCGKGYLAKAIPYPIWEYDPAIPGKEESPRPADLVVCTDTLEHIEPDKLMYVLDDLRRCVKQVGYFTIHTQAAKKCYANGENTHLIQRGKDWWVKRLKKFFVIGQVFEVGPELHVVVAPKAKPKVSVQATQLVEA